MYDQSLFAPEHISQLNDHLCRLLGGLAALGDLDTQTDGAETMKPAIEIGKLPMLSAAEQQQLLQLTNTRVDFDQSLCIHELFERQAKAVPDNIALVFEHQQLSYQALNEKANQLACCLIERYGVGADTLVGLCVERSVEMIVAMLAILKAGGAYVPMDPHSPKARLEYILADTGVTLVLSQSHLRERLKSQTCQVVSLDDKRWQAQLHDYAKDNIDKASIALESRDLAYVIYTSGSTGKPKGVMIEHRGVINLCQYLVRTMALGEHTIALLMANYVFDASVFEIFPCLGVGCPFGVDRACGSER